MREDILKHISNLTNAIEELISTYEDVSQKNKIDTRLEEKIKNIQQIVKWSTNE
jgi:archaellum component FlaC